MHTPCTCTAHGRPINRPSVKFCQYRYRGGHFPGGHPMYSGMASKHGWWRVYKLDRITGWGLWAPVWEKGYWFKTKHEAQTAVEEYYARPAVKSDGYARPAVVYDGAEQARLREAAEIAATGPVGTYVPADQTLAEAQAENVRLQGAIAELVKTADLLRSDLVKARIAQVAATSNLDASRALTDRQAREIKQIKSCRIDDANVILRQRQDVLDAIDEKNKAWEECRSRRRTIDTQEKQLAELTVLAERYRKFYHDKLMLLPQEQVVDMFITAQEESR
jgi:hypothetical protein